MWKRDEKAEGRGGGRREGEGEREKTKDSTYADRYVHLQIEKNDFVQT